MQKKAIFAIRSLRNFSVHELFAHPHYSELSQETARKWILIISKLSALSYATTLAGNRKSRQLLSGGRSSPYSRVVEHRRNKWATVPKRGLVGPVPRVWRGVWMASGREKWLLTYLARGKARGQSRRIGLPRASRCRRLNPVLRAATTVNEHLSMSGQGIPGEASLRGTSLGDHPMAKPLFLDTHAKTRLIIVS